MAPIKTRFSQPEPSVTDLHDGAVRIPEDREEQECDRQDKQGAERRAREQVTGSRARHEQP